MSGEQSDPRSLESLKKEAKRWLTALRENAADATARFERALSKKLDNATLRDVQHALAREHGYSGWLELKLAVDAATARRLAAGSETLARYEEMATALLDAYRTGTPEAMERHYSFTWHRRVWSAMRTYAQLDVGKRPSRPGDDVELTIDDARYLVARDYGFESWAELKKFSASGVFRPRPQPESEPPAAPLRDEEVVELNLSGSKDLTDNTLHELKRYPNLKKLNIEGTGVTPRGLAVLSVFPNLDQLSVDATDEWMPYLAAMPHLKKLSIQDTPATDEGWIALSKSASIEGIWGRRCHGLQTRGFLALAKMPKLNNLAVSCLNVAEEGIAALPTFPSLRELMPMDIPDMLYEHIAKCENLERLVLMYCRDTTDAATEHIVALKKLTYYFNSYTTITDRTPEILATMDSLQFITLDACHWITEAGVAKLARLPNLRGLRVAGRQISAAAMARAAAMPRNLTGSSESQ